MTTHARLNITLHSLDQYCAHCTHQGVIADLTRADVQGLHWPGQSWATKYRLINGAGGVALKRKPDAEKWLLRDMARCVYN